jgi:hypothetical protein
MWIVKQTVADGENNDSLVLLADSIFEDDDINAKMELVLDSNEKEENTEESTNEDN